MEKMNIPKTINVGFQQRNGTYTGKLAYVVYTDEKGVLRKEASWNSWRDKKIEPEQHDNVPTSGFVLNKGVGGARQSWGWNPRNEYIRVYDPRGFEFEISVANLLFILQECSSFKGKGLEGEFVYAWNGTELVLLPVGCYEYKQSTEFTSLKTMKISQKEMKEGLVYQHKDMTNLLYIGRHKCRLLDSYKYSYEERQQALFVDPTEYRHVFVRLHDEPQEQTEWYFDKGFTKLAKIVSDQQHPDFAQYYTEFTASDYVSPFKSIDLVTITDIDRLNTGSWLYLKNDNGYTPLYLAWQRPYFYDPHFLQNRPHYYRDGVTFDSSEIEQMKTMTKDCFWPVRPTSISEVTTNNMITNPYRASHQDQHIYHASKEYLKTLDISKLFTLRAIFQSGTQSRLYGYV